MKRRFILTALLILTALPAFAAGPAIDRVNGSNSLRCGYVEYEPALSKDLKTGQWHGFDYDIVQAITNRLDLKTEYAAATGWGTVAADLNAGKFDMLCSTFWVHPNVAKFALFSRPAYFQPVFLVVRTNDSRFGGTRLLNDPKLTMVAIDGDNPIAIAKADFPQAKISTLPNMTDPSQVLLAIADGKGDFTITDAMTFGDYAQHNPGKLRIVNPDRPVRVYPSSYVFRSDDGQLRDAVNAALDELILDGTIDRIMNKYDTYPNGYYRATVPYRNPYKQEE